MQRLIEQFDSHASRHPRHRRLYRQLRRHQPQDARRDRGRPSARRGAHERQFHARIRHQRRGDLARPTDRQDGQTPDQFMARVLAGAEAERDRRTATSMACRSRTPRRCCITASMRSRRPGSIPTSRPSPGRTGSMTCEKLTKHDGSQTTRWGLMFPGTYDYLRLDHQRPGDGQRRRLLQHQLRRRGLLQRAHHHRRGEADRRAWCTSGK